ncbi:MAG: hypothetical protein HOP29_12730 [Phycisphaerales bacterium]|nr:hypothetical protein [Phycisphaerales bacterium]
MGVQGERDEGTEGRRDKGTPDRRSSGFGHGPRISAIAVALSIHACSAMVICGCVGTVPSKVNERTVHLPAPRSALEVAPARRLTPEGGGEAYVITPRRLISIAFELQPDIKSSYQRYQSEEARYDFFYASLDALTPQLSVSNRLGESRDTGEDDVAREREQTARLGVEKLFFDTTRMNVDVGYRADEFDEAEGYRPFVSASVRYPLWASREKLERTSEDIFRRNELNDVQLGYIQEVRERLENALFRFHDVIMKRRDIEYQTRWRDDVRALLETVQGIQNRDVTTDRLRVEAELSRVTALLRNQTGRYEIDLQRFKASCGIPFYAEATLDDEPFNPFTEGDHATWMQLSIETDPEIATLRNEVQNAQVQLDLARRGTWDVALLMDGRSDLEGRGENDGESDWSVSMGFELSQVDPRVTESLARQAQGRINRFQQAIVARENTIFVDTLEPLVRIKTIGQSRDELIANLPKYEDDYEFGVAEYAAARLNIDDLLKRRVTWYEQELLVADHTFLIGANVAELCAATGKFFEYLGEDAANGVIQVGEP